MLCYAMLCCAVLCGRAGGAATGARAAGRRAFNCFLDAGLQHGLRGKRGERGVLTGAAAAAAQREVEGQVRVR